MHIRYPCDYLFYLFSRCVFLHSSNAGFIIQVIFSIVTVQSYFWVKYVNVLHQSDVSTEIMPKFGFKASIQA